MRIAINAKCLTEAELSGCGYYMREIFHKLAQQHPHHQYLLFSDKKIEQPIFQFPNVTNVYIKSTGKNALSLRWWFDVKIPLALRKHKAEVFITFNNLSKLTSVPQLLILNNYSFQYLSKDLLKLSVKKAHTIITLTESVKEKVVDQARCNRDKIVVINGASKNHFKQIDWSEKETIKEQYAEGCEYFVFAGPVNPHKNLLNVLKAFSLFKKRQKTNLKMMVAGTIHGDMIEKLESYKYKDDVKLTGYLPEPDMAKLIAGAYALIYVPLSEGFCLPVFEAMQSGVPVLANSSAGIMEITGEAALFSDPSTPESIAENMKIVFKDEQLRHRLIQNGNERSEMFSWDVSANEMLSAIEATVSK